MTIAIHIICQEFTHLKHLLVDLGSPGDQTLILHGLLFKTKIDKFSCIS